VHSGFHWDDRKRGIVGVGLPFGRISAEDLAELADRARAHGAHELRLTPWRALLIPLASTQAADSFLAALRRIDSFIFDDADPRRYIAACVGAPACARATTDVRSDATRLASLVATAVDRRIALHVSGCPKGCAHRGAAPVTLIGRDGLYDLVRDGTPADMPARRGLTLDQAVALLRGEESTA
jgi:precorrin-3B synthase